MSNFGIIHSKEAVGNICYLLKRFLPSSNFKEILVINQEITFKRSDLRHVVERYSSFFDSKDRTKRLGNYVEVRDGMSAEELKLGMLCALSRA